VCPTSPRALSSPISQSRFKRFANVGRGIFSLLLFRIAPNVLWLKKAISRSTITAHWSDSTSAAIAIGQVMSPRMAILFLTKSSILACAPLKPSNQNHIKYLTGFELEKEYSQIFFEHHIVK
jgi:hypothetical protein